MKTFGMGDIVLHNVQSIDEGLAIAQSIGRLNRIRDDRDYLRRVSHGHVFPFGPFSECECGMSHIDYFMQSYTSDNSPCKASQAKLLDRETAGAEYARLDKLFKESR